MLSGGFTSRYCKRLPNKPALYSLPLNQIGSLNKINKTFARLEQEFEREPSPEEIAEILDLPKDKVIDSISVSGRHVSVDAPFKDDEEGTLLDVLPNTSAPKTDKQLTYESLQVEMQRALQTLPAREREILKMYYGIGYAHNHSLDEISRTL